MIIIDFFDISACLAVCIVLIIIQLSKKKKVLLLWLTQAKRSKTFALDPSEKVVPVCLLSLVSIVCVCAFILNIRGQQSNSAYY